MQTDPFLKATALVKRYGSFTAVDHIDFEVFKGACFGFLGPNGAGKTSVMKMIQCFSPITEGTIEIDRMQVGHDDRKIKSIIGVAPQENSLDTDLSVTQNLVIYGRYYSLSHNNAKKRSAELLKLFHLQEKADVKIRELSGGMQRRLLIARALMSNPKLLILDEPTTGLDPQARSVIWQKLTSLKEEGVTILLSTHYMEEAKKLCDEIALMDKGHILAVGAPDNLLAEHIGAEVLEIVPSDGHRKELVAMLNAMQAKFERYDDRFAIYIKRDGEQAAELVRSAPGTLEWREPRLEDLFLKMTGDWSDQ